MCHTFLPIKYYVNYFLVYCFGITISSYFWLIILSLAKFKVSFALADIVFFVFGCLEFVFVLLYNVVFAFSIKKSSLLFQLKSRLCFGY